jgi:hypothetical protein
MTPAALAAFPLHFLQDRMMAELHARGKTAEDIRDCLMSAPLDAHVISSIKTAAALGCAAPCPP